MLLIVFLRLLIIFSTIGIVFTTTILLAKIGIVVAPFFESCAFKTLKASPLSNRGVRLGVPPADESK